MSIDLIRDLLYLENLLKIVKSRKLEMFGKVTRQTGAPTSKRGRLRNINTTEWTGKNMTDVGRGQATVDR